MKPAIMMVSSEASPWAKTGGLAEVLESLPAALGRIGHPVAVVIPRYMGARNAPARRVWDTLPVRVGTTVFRCSVWKLDSSENVTLFFVDEPGLFERDGIYGDRGSDFGDNHVRFAVLSRAAMEIARRIWTTHVFHCHDWQSALIPLFLKNDRVVDPAFIAARSVLTIHNLGYQGIFDRSKLGETGIPASAYHPGGVEFWGKINFLKAGIAYADAVTTVSRRYAAEIQTAEYGYNLEGVIAARKGCLQGILNGIDYSRWNPASDPLITAHYDTGNLAGKRACKRELIREMGLPEAAMDRPVLGIVSRFAGQKGFDLLADAAEAIFRQDAYLAALGSGEWRIEGIFHHLRARFPDRVAVRFGYDETLAHRIEAGSDMFLMPSKYEPCGLNQIYSLRYGTVPVVRATGGLDDTVEDPAQGDGTGFKFDGYNGEALREAVERACRLFEDREAWTAMMERGMQKDYSWTASAAEYSNLYCRLLDSE